mmetsp:Transcript_20645/g.64673  ORF Transcript_20645/g.64673 Transcript_20645/m.64673 type:complete len:246 (+) Transcript_20645:839-1576(+)
MGGHIYFRRGRGDGQAALGRVLRAYACYNRALGYTQGMSSYAAVLLLHLGEEDAFWVLATLLDVCGLARLFEDGFPLLHHFYDCWEALLRKRMPRLAAHIDGALGTFLGLDECDYAAMRRAADPARFALPGLYATAWFQTMCVGGAHPAPSDLAPRIMDNLLLDGHLGIVFALSLAVLRVEALAISALQGEALIDALKALPSRVTNDNALFEVAFDMAVSARHIEEREAGEAPESVRASGRMTPT